jgi:hypothetical protein
LPFSPRYGIIDAAPATLLSFRAASAAAAFISFSLFVISLRLLMPY